MPGPEDRDIRRPKTPPAGVRAQTAQPESFEDETPIDGDPVSQINTRARNAAHNSKQAVTRIAVLDAKVDGYQRQVDTYFELDQQDHKRIYQQLDATIDTLNTIQTSIADIRGDVGEAVGAVRTLTATIQEKAKVDTAREIAKAEVDAKAAIVKVEIEQAQAESDVAIEQKREIVKAEIEHKRELATIEDRVDTARFRRKRSYKILTIIGAIISAIVTYELTR